MSKLLNRIVKPSLTAGRYVINVASYEEIDNEQGGYLKVTYQFPDRLLTQCYFLTVDDLGVEHGNLKYLEKNLNRQLSVANDSALSQLLELAKQPSSLIAFVSYSKEFGFNLALHEASSNELPEVAF